MRLIVTRPAAQAAGWVDRLRGLGVDARALPLLDIEPAADPAPLHAAWRGLAGYRLVMFVSANAVVHFMALRPVGAGWPAAVLAAATGPGTAAALRDARVDEACIVEPAADAPSFDSEALWARLSSLDWTDRRVLVVRGEDGRDWLADQLRTAGAQTDFVAAYRRVAPQPDAVGRELLQAAQTDPASHVWLFSSSEAVGHLRTLAEAADWSRSSALATHPRIAAAAQQLGFGRVETVAPDPKALAERLASGWSIQSFPL